MCVCLCCLELLNTLCFTIICLAVALLLACIKLASFCFPLKTLYWAGFSFHTNDRSLRIIIIAVVNFYRSKARQKKSLVKTVKSISNTFFLVPHQPFWILFLLKHLHIEWTRVEWRSALFYSHENQRIAAITSKLSVSLSDAKGSSFPFNLLFLSHW